MAFDAMPASYVMALAPSTYSPRSEFKTIWSHYAIILQCTTKGYGISAAASTGNLGLGTDSGLRSEKINFGARRFPFGHGRRQMAADKIWLFQARSPPSGNSLAGEGRPSSSGPLQSFDTRPPPLAPAKRIRPVGLSSPLPLEKGQRTHVNLFRRPNSPAPDHLDRIAGFVPGMLVGQVCRRTNFGSILFGLRRLQFAGEGATEHQAFGEHAFGAGEVSSGDGRVSNVVQ